MGRRIMAAAVCILFLAAPAAAQTVDLVVAATTDVHGRVRGWDYYADTAESARGLSRAATIVDSVREANPGRVILVDAGDFLQGNPFADVAARVDSAAPNAVVAAMNVLHYDAVTLGNHEFNYGVPSLRHALATANFPLLAANVAGGPKPPAWRPYTVVERGGVKIGIVGATTPGSMVWDAANLRAAHVTVSAIIPAIAGGVRAARAAGADIVVVVAHSGISGESNYDTLAARVGGENPMAQVPRAVPGIDLIVFGHTHREVADSVIDGVLFTQPRNWATSVSLAHLVVEKREGKWRVVSKRASVVRSAGHQENAAVLAASQRGYDDARTYARTVIGHTAVAWSSESSRVADVPIMDFVAETMRRISGADLASVAAFSTDVRIPAGPVTVAQMAQLYPYENTLRVLRITGAQLRAYLEHSARYFRVIGAGDSARVSANPAIPGYNFEIVTGVDYAIDLSKQPGQRITGLTRRGVPVRDADSFTIALSNYRAEGAGGYAMLRGSPLVSDRQQDIRQTLIDEVARRNALNPADYFTRNWKLEPPSLAEQASARMRAEHPFESVAAGAPHGASKSDAPRALAGSREPVATTIRIISTNDFHGALDARADGNFGMRGGAAQLAAMIRRAESECSGSCASVYLDGGDEFQGTPESNLAYGRPVTDLFNQLGLAASAIGNHDFDWGQDTLRARMRQAHYAMLGANIHFADGRNVPWIRQDTIVVRGGVKIGIVGIATPLTPSTTKAVNVAGLRFDDPVATVNEQAKSLRARGADLVIVVEHDGAFCDRGAACRGEIIQLAQRLSEPVDAIVSGHTHSLVNTTVKGIPIVQAMSSGRAIGVIDLPVDRAAREGTHEYVRIVKTDSITADPEADAIEHSATENVASVVARPIATAPAAMPRRGDQYALGNLIADAQRAAAHADVAVMNNGGIRTELRAGPVSYGALFEIQPFGNMLVRVTVKGSDLRAYLESFVAHGAPRVHVSGVIVHYDLARHGGARVVSATVDGVPLDDARTYTVAFTDFMATGGEGLILSNAALKQDALGIVDLDALIAFVQSQPGGIIKPDAAPRLIPVPR
jgi:2',3'-cyclic-nucleotide 2'-phosphodiesterase/3'-nucleotidase/5'-nucleotidase